LTGAVETVVFPNSYPKFEPYMSADFPILVSGRFETEDEKSCKLIASEMQPLSGISERSAKTLRIRACITNLSPDTATNLLRLLESNRGETGVEVELYNPPDFRVNIQSADFVKVKSSPELIRRIEVLCGPGSVNVIS
jgi:DNA polymerase III alpha subunit